MRSISRRLSLAIFVCVLLLALGISAPLAGAVGETTWISMPETLSGNTWTIEQVTPEMVMLGTSNGIHRSINGVVKADLFVVREITSMPSVLVECLFLSHPADEMLLLDKRFDERYMEAVAEGIADWFTEGTGAAGPESPRARSGG